MGTKERRAREKEARRQLILTAAKRMLCEKGFTHASMEDVAREAELSPGALYLYFKSKDEILAALLLNSIRYFNMRLVPISDDENATPEEKVQHLKCALGDLLAFDPLIYRKVIHMQASKVAENISSPVIEALKSVLRHTCSTMTEIFRKNLATSIDPRPDPEQYTDFICSLFLGVLYRSHSQVFSGSDPDILKRVLESAFEIFFNCVSRDVSQTMKEKAPA